MKKLFLVILALASINSINAQTENEQATTQQEESKEKKDQKKKKRGALWNKVKKGVESSTGIDVSKETLFVYPEIGEWKMVLKSANGNLETGELTVMFGVMPLADHKSASISMTDVVDGNNKTLEQKKYYERSSNKPRVNTYLWASLPTKPVTVGVYTDFQLKPIYVEKGMKTMKTIKFSLGSKQGFEARDIPITWVK